MWPLIKNLVTQRADITDAKVDVADANIDAIKALLGTASPSSGATTDVMKFIKLLYDRVGASNPTEADTANVMNYLKLIKDSLTSTASFQDFLQLHLYKGVLNTLTDITISVNTTLTESVIFAKNFTVASGVTLTTALTGKGVVIVADSITIDGTIFANWRGYPQPGAQTGNTSDVGGNDGGGSALSLGGSGGGGGTHGGTGGNGGENSDGITLANKNGKLSTASIFSSFITPSTVLPARDLAATNLLILAQYFAGGAGGNGGYNTNSSNSSAVALGRGGAGGGGIVLIAPIVTLSATGVLSAIGQAGGNGAGSTDRGSSGGGGGGGGCVVVDAAQFDNFGTVNVTGGAAGGSPKTGTPGIGGDGRFIII